MSEPVILERQPYRGMDPWENLEPHMLPGVSRFSTESVAAMADRNLVHYNVRVRINRDLLEPPNVSGMRVFIQGIPAHLRPVAGTPVAAYAAGQLVPVVVDWGGRIGIPNASGLDPRDFSDIGFSLTTVRRQP